MRRRKERRGSVKNLGCNRGGLRNPISADCYPSTVGGKGRTLTSSFTPLLWNHMASDLGTLNG